MCIASFIGDDFSRRIGGSPWTTLPVDTMPGFPNSDTKLPGQLFNPASRTELEALRKEVADLRVLLEQAKTYDKDHDEPNCELEEKIALVKHFGEVFSIDFHGVFDNDIETASDQEFEPFRVVTETGEVARFSDLVLAHKFADYVAAYSGDKNVAIIEVADYSVDNLKYGVTLNKVLIATFLNEQDARDFIEDRETANAIMGQAFGEPVDDKYSLIFVSL